jgi:hypothetical protein
MITAQAGNFFHSTHPGCFEHGIDLLQQQWEDGCVLDTVAIESKLIPRLQGKFGT